MSLVPSYKEKAQEQWEIIKSLKGKKRFEHIWEYYRLWIIGFVIFIFVLISIINPILNPPPTVILSVSWSYSFQMSEFFDDLSYELTNEMIVPYAHETIDVLQLFFTGDAQMDMANMQRFAAMISSRDIDIIIASYEELESYANQDILTDLRSFLPTTTEGFLWAENSNGVSSVYGVNIQNSKILENSSFFMVDKLNAPYVGIIINTDRFENARKAVEALLK
jgi:hypothetical protein